MSKDQSEPVRSHKDLDKDAAPYFKKAVKFYENLANQLVSQGHVLDLFASALDQVCVSLQFNSVMTSKILFFIFLFFNFHVISQTGSLLVFLFFHRDYFFSQLGHVRYIPFFKHIINCGSCHFPHGNLLFIYLFLIGKLHMHLVGFEPVAHPPSHCYGRTKYQLR